MQKKFITLNPEKYVNGWSDIPLAGFTEIQANKELIGVLDCVKVNDGIAVLDKGKQQELINIPEQFTEMEQLQQENKELKDELKATNKAVLEISDYVFSREV